MAKVGVMQITARVEQYSISACALCERHRRRSSMETIDAVVAESAKLFEFDNLKELWYFAKIPLAASS